METSNEHSIKVIYNDRSPNYDSASQFHPRQATEYIQRASLKQNQSVLDLACGTGLVTIPAKQQVGGAGRVVGVDISSGMLEVARGKAKAQDLDIEFIEHDIMDLDGLELGQFDFITCASALLLLKDPLRAVKHWASLLVPGGRLLTDVMVEKNVLAPRILRKIGPVIGTELEWNGGWVQGEESLRKLFVDAGLVVEQVYTSDAYETREYGVEDGGEVFEKIVESPNFRNFGMPAVREKAREVFLEEFRGMADSDGVVREELRFYMGIAKKAAGG